MLCRYPPYNSAGGPAGDYLEDASEDALIALLKAIILRAETIFRIPNHHSQLQLGFACGTSCVYGDGVEVSLSMKLGEFFYERIHPI
jgi:hypothetical protein